MMCAVRYSSVYLSRVEGGIHTIYAGVTLFALVSEISLPLPTFVQPDVRTTRRFAKPLVATRMGRL
jgi:hypothetical protein